jgi:thiol-disulfide isomerase/thioredoxin
MSRATFIALTLAIVAGAALMAVNEGGSNETAALEANSNSTPADDDTNEPAATITTLSEGPEVIGTAPDLEKLDGWLNTDKTQFTDFDGQIKIVQFWTFGCINCKRTLENLGEIYAKHGDNPNFEIIGVHSPEFNHEADVDNIIAASADLGVVWPIALDTNKFNFRKWQEDRRFWPRTYIVDSSGQIRYDHIGEGKYEELAATVDWLLANKS